MAGVILVRDIMSKNVKTARPDSLISDVVAKMNKFRIGSVVVVQGRKPVGIITERDILRKVVEPGLDPRTVKARDIMSAPILIINEEVSVEEAASIMTRNSIKKLPVVKNGNLVGIVTATDLVKSTPKIIDLVESLFRLGGKS